MLYKATIGCRKVYSNFGEKKVRQCVSRTTLIRDAHSHKIGPLHPIKKGKKEVFGNKTTKWP